MDSREQRIPITAAGLLLTYWCNARCAHCYEMSGPERRAWMSEADARRHLAALARLGVPASGVHIGGGEPFGDYPLLLTVVRAARDAGLDGIGYVETNGYWATEPESVRRRLESLRDAGMRQVSISADVFHQAYVDPACVARLWHIACDILGSGGVRARRWRFLKEPTDLRSASDAERRAAYREALQVRAERMTGRAAQCLSALVPRRPAAALAPERCGKALRHSGHVHVDPYGHVFPGTCVGLVLGRATRDRPLDAVLAGPRGQLWRLLVERGPYGLMRYAVSCGYREAVDGYADKCHLCTSVRTFLRRSGRHEDELAPAEVYENI